MLVTPGRSPAVVGTFFDESWTLYQKILYYNHMHHRQLYAIVHTLLAQATEAFDFLDLGCGDASFSAIALANTPIVSYTGVDLSHRALEKAASHLAPLRVPIRLFLQDFGEFVQHSQQQFAWVLSAFSLHHYSSSQKYNFLRSLHRLLPANGTLILIDVFRRDQESLPEYYHRYIGHACAVPWQLTGREFRRLEEHITTSDLPESPTAMVSIANGAGFQKADWLFLAPETTIGLLRLQP